MKLQAGKNKPEAALFELMADTVKDYAIFMLDNDGKFVTWNKGASDIFGYEEQEVIGKDFAMLFTPEDQQKGISVHGKCVPYGAHFSLFCL